MERWDALLVTVSVTEADYFILLLLFLSHGFDLWQFFASFPYKLL